MVIPSDEILKLLLAILIGGSIGIERELHHKAAGFRTLTLICVGAALFTILDQRYNASGRIAANIVTGVGFLGAGVILRDNAGIKGLTTAAMVWMSAALGMAVGLGAYLQSVTAAILVLVVMTLFNFFEHRMNDLINLRRYEVVLDVDLQKATQIEALMHSSGLRLGLRTQMKRDGLLVCTWDASGTVRRQQDFLKQILADPEVKSITW